MGTVATAAEVREFLTSRRDRITPQEAGLSGEGGRRRVMGLRREEVALLAGISVEYYTQLERGKAVASADVLDAVARTLQLDDVERAHLFDLVRALKQRPPGRRRRTDSVRPSVQRTLDTITDAAAVVRNARVDLLSANRLGYSLFSEVFSNPERPVNLARFDFLDPRARELYVDWDAIADAAVEILRVEAGRDPYDRELTDLIVDLSMRSDEFRARWAAHNVGQYCTGVQGFRHPLVGELTLNYEVLDLLADPGQVLVVYSARAGSRSQDALARLRAWGEMKDDR